MNNSHDKDELRFEKLYKLLGEEVNSIYDTKKEDEIFTINNNQNNTYIKEITSVINDYNNNVTKNENNISNNTNQEQIVNNAFKNNPNQINPIYNNINSISNQIQHNNIINNNQNQVVQNNQINNNLNSLQHDNVINSNQNEIQKNNVTNIIPKEPTKVSFDPINVVNTTNNQPNISEISIPVEKKFHNETIITGKNIYDDFDNINYDKKNIKDLLTNKKFISIILVITFICVCTVVAKAFYFGKKIDHYEEFFTEITKKEEESTKIYENMEINNETLKKMAASELINCIKMPIDMNNLPSSITDTINDINNYYNRSNNYFAFAYKDIFTGFTVSYNANQKIFTASTIKGPTDIYLYEMASQGKINLDDTLTYTGKYYNTGSGILKSKPFNTNYSVRKLLELSTINSDNAAHNMLMDRYGRENMLKFWQEHGTTAIFTNNSNWGVTCANDALIYMTELYNFYATNDTYGEAVMNNFLKASPKFIKGDGTRPIANKFGWSGTAIHDVSIVFADNPYITVALSNLGETNEYTSYFNKANDFSQRLHNEYWKYKMNMCNNIKQY